MNAIHLPAHAHGFGEFKRDLLQQVLVTVGFTDDEEHDLSTLFCIWEPSGRLVGQLVLSETERLEIIDRLSRVAPSTQSSTEDDELYEEQS